jgi:DNA-binding NtrC family response regulator
VQLVVDDDEGSCEFMSSALSRARFRVIQASSGTAAVQLFERHSEEIAAVVLDCTMPGFSEEPLFDALCEIRPEVQIVLVSGYSRERVADALLQRGAVGFIQKPFEPEDFADEVRRLAAG